MDSGLALRAPRNDKAMMTALSPLLPIDAVLPDLIAQLREGNTAVLVAPPGAGKTTRVPLALAAEDWAAGRRILVLEPRRLAAPPATWRTFWAGVSAAKWACACGSAPACRAKRLSKSSPKASSPA